MKLIPANSRCCFNFLITLWVIALCVSLTVQAKSGKHQPVVQELVSMLETDAKIKGSLTQAITKADLKGINNLDGFFTYLDDLVTWIPTERLLVPKVVKFHYIINQANDDSLNSHPEFSAWMKKYVAQWGKFLDSPESAKGIESFAVMPNYNVDDYFVGPSGWLTFNQFFAREIRPGKRPIAAPKDDKVIVSPADAIFMGQWPIDDSSKITVKGATWEISQLMDGSPYKDAFKNGVYTHSFLFVDDYHRYHVPVGGTVKEIRNISGRVYLEVIKDKEGNLEPIDGDTYQFNQERGLVVIDSPEVGLVAILPIGMSVVSSVNLTPEKGAQLRKGDEFGYFLFGGSDIVMLFQDKNVRLGAEVGKKYLQGQKLGSVD